MWEFCENFGYTERVPEARKRKLFASPGYSKQLAELSDCQILGFTWKNGSRHDLQEFHRSEFLLEISTELYDAFFNSPAGYRAQYAISELDGEAANRAAIDSVKLRLLRFASEFCSGQSVLACSLEGKGAKIWIEESEVREHLRQSAPEIDFETWKLNSESGLGLLAPLGSRLGIKGAWTDSFGNVFVDPFKQFRSKHIHETGFS